MPHITFIHGISNKPAPDALERLWLGTLSIGGLDLRDENVTSRHVYWADVLYAAPEADAAAFESALESRPESYDAAGAAATPPAATAEEQAFLEGLRAKLTAVEPGQAPPAPPTVPGGADQAPLERIPLPWFIKERFLEHFLRDVHHYLFDAEFTPRPGETFRVQQEIRRRFIDTLSVPNIEPPHVVVSHSMGTVIAYDCLKRVGGCPRVDALITIGSPLGIDEIQDKLRPEWRRHDGFPSVTVAEEWVNVSDRLDVVCAADPKLASDFQGR